MAFDSPPINPSESLEELSGTMQPQEEDKLMHLVLEHDGETVEDGKLAAAALSHGISFTPDMMFEKLVKEYAMTEHVYGESLIQLLSGYSPSYLKKNVRIPEFQRKLKAELGERFDRLKKSGYVTKSGSLTPKAVELASLVLYMEEIEHLLAKGMLGTKNSKRTAMYGERSEIREYKHGDRYKDIAVRQSVKTAIRRLHSSIDMSDLRVFTRKSKGSVELIYALDASGSMKGSKLEMAKRAGIALSFTAIQQKDKVGLLVFGKRIRDSISPTSDFIALLKGITCVAAREETDMVSTIKKSVELFSRQRMTKHLILLTDALPTIGSDEETLGAVALARSSGVTVSVVGMNLDSSGRRLAKRIVEIGKGRLYLAKKEEELDAIVLQDYYSVA